MLDFPVRDSPGTLHTYTVLCWPAGAVWAVRMPELGRESSAARLSQVEAVARALVGTYTEDDPSAVTFKIDLLPDTLSSTLSAAAAAREAADNLDIESVRERRALARQLSGEGLTLADVAAALGVSLLRARQLVNDRPTGAARPGPRAGPERAHPSRRGHHGYRHEALLYRGDEEFLGGTVPFIEEGLILGQPVMVAVPEPRLTLLRETLGKLAQRVRLVDMGRLGRNPARIIPAWRQYVEESCRHGQPARGISEPLWPGRHQPEVAECQLHEALLNIAVESWRPLWLRCPYDVDRLGTPEAQGALHGHSVVVEEFRHRDGPGYGASSHRPGVFAGPPEDPPAFADRVCFDSATLSRLRPHVAAGAAVAGVPPPRAADLTLAMWELGVNSVRHGGGSGVLRTWREGDAFVCEVRDHGHIDDPLAGRRVPDPATPGQRGIWLVNQLCDLVQLRSSAAGTTVRVFTWL